MIPATQTPVQMRLVRDDPNEVASLRRQLGEAQRRAAQLDEHLSRLNSELRLAGRLQRDFLPKVLPHVGPARFASVFRPAGHVSGDCYDVFRLDEEHVGFYVADAVGHGVPAALLTMFIRHKLTTKQIVPGCGYRLLSPGETLAKLNADLLDEGLSADTFATAVYGTIDVTTRRVTLARAGHPAPFVLTAAGLITPVDCDGGLLGVTPDEVYDEASFDLSAGDRLLLYTDGVEVAFATSANDSLGRWRDLVTAHARSPAADLLAGVAAAADDFNGGPPRDDLTLLSLELA